MNTAPIFVFGAGGHGRVVAEIMLACGWNLQGFLDDAAEEHASTMFGLPVRNADHGLKSGPRGRVALGIGDNGAREAIAERVRNAGGSLISAVHPSAIISPSANLAEGVVVMAGAVLNAECRIFEGAIINTGAVIEHDVQVGRYAHVSSNCTTGGGAQIGDRALVGLGAVVLPGKRIGSDSLIGAGAVVTSDIGDGEVAYGVPARVQRRNR
jgi:sugar O-acyltransferase (sialic acid O-acetyltransferase NeuD family)